MFRQSDLSSVHAPFYVGQVVEWTDAKILDGVIRTESGHGVITAIAHKLCSVDVFGTSRNVAIAISDLSAK